MKTAQLIIQESGLVAPGFSHPTVMINCGIEFDRNAGAWRAFDDAGNTAYSDHADRAALNCFDMRLIGPSRGPIKIFARLEYVTALDPTLACVHLPANCSLHSADGSTIARVLSLAKMIGEHWAQQDGVNGALLDELAALVKNGVPGI